jgi:hypothetical protein
MENAAAEPRRNWTKPKDQEIVRPTYAPAVVAAGMICLFWGLVTTILISLLGCVLLAAGLTVWIGELRHEYE